MSKVFTALSRHLTPLPIVKPDWDNGMKLTAVAAGNPVQTPDLPAGGYLVSVGAAPLFMRADGFAAEDAAGSIYMSAGSTYHLAVDDGAAVSILALDADASAFVVPLS